MKALQAFTFHEPSPAWEPGWWQVKDTIGVSYFGRCWHVVRFTKRLVQVWDYGSGKKALRDALRLARGRVAVEPDLEVSL